MMSISMSSGGNNSNDSGNDNDSPSGSQCQDQCQDAWFDNCLSPAASNLSFMLNSPCGRLTPTHGEVGIGTPMSDNMLKNDSFAAHFSPSIFSPSKKITMKLVKKRDNTKSNQNSKSIFQNDQNFPIL